MSRLNLKELTDLELYMIHRTFTEAASNIELGDYSEKEQTVFENLWKEVEEEFSALVKRNCITYKDKE